MKSFNTKLELEGNNSIDNALTAGVELAPFTPVTLPRGITLQLPLGGAEYIKARSKTTHISRTVATNAATVNWNLPAFGVYVAPEITYRAWYFRPVAPGYYWLGRRLRDGLTTTDQPGARLDVSDETIGTTSTVGWIVPLGRTASAVRLSIETGFRYLNFTNVKATPRGNFQVASGFAQVTNLPEDLDYSGWIIRGVVSFK
jgi:hypothetical protein